MSGAEGSGHVRSELLPMGDAALLLETDGINSVLALDRALRAHADTAEGVWAVVDDIVPAARTVLVHARPGTDLADLAAAIRHAVTGVSAAAYEVSGDEVEIPVRYDGADLDEVARLTGLSTAEVVAAHTGTPWRVGFGGFVPGFAYLVGGDPRLEVPRRESPRTSVPSGAVGLAGQFSGVYPRASPGGWQLVGSTDAVLWDAHRHPPALLSPGTTVRFVERNHAGGGSATTASTTAPSTADRSTTHPSETTRPTTSPPATAPSTTSPPREPTVTEERAVTRGVEILEVGMLTLVQDAGRLGHMAVGVSRAGAADRTAYELGARLLGNSPDSAALEVTLGGLVLRALGELTLCLTGAPAPATVDGRPVGHAAPFAVAADSVLSLGHPTSGLRTYVSVRGGIEVEPVLGSRASDTMSGLGRPALEPGQVLPVGPVPPDLPRVDQAPVAHPETGLLTLRVTPGPRLGWFADPEQLSDRPWTVSDRSDRRGIRLEGYRVERHEQTRDVELASEGMVRGAIQVPPNGEPVIFLNDHPVTGGYPVIGVVRSADIDRMAQLTPGQQVSLRWDVGRTVSDPAVSHQAMSARPETP